MMAFSRWVFAELRGAHAHARCPRMACASRLARSRAPALHTAAHTPPCLPARLPLPVTDEACRVFCIFFARAEVGPAQRPPPPCVSVCLSVCLPLLCRAELSSMAVRVELWEGA